MESNDLEARVAALETQVSGLDKRVRASEHDAAAARVLAGAADRDVGELGDELRDFRHATMTSFNALREDMNDRFARVDDGFIEMRSRLDAAVAGQQHIVDLIEGLGRDRGDNGGPRA